MNSITHHSYHSLLEVDHSPAVLAVVGHTRAVLEAGAGHTRAVLVAGADHNLLAADHSQAAWVEGADHNLVELAGVVRNH